MTLKEIIFEYLINNDPVRADIPAGESITGLIYDAVAPIYNPQDVKYFRVQISQSLSSVRRQYDDPRETPCFYYRKVNGKYEIITTNPSYAQYMKDDIISQFKPHVESLKNQIRKHKMLPIEQQKKIDNFMLELQIDLGVLQKIKE